MIGETTRLLYHTNLNDPRARGRRHASGDWQTFPKSRWLREKREKERERRQIRRREEKIKEKEERAERRPQTNRPRESADRSRRRT